MPPLSILTALVVSLAGCNFDGAVPSNLGEPPGPSKSDSGAPDSSLPLRYIAYWSFDTDASNILGAHDGELRGQATISTGGQGFRGEALQLLGDGDRVDVQNPEQFDFNSDFSWHAYIRTQDGSGAILSRSPQGSDWNQGSKALFVRSDDVQWDTGWVSNPDTNTTVSDDEWHQVIVTFHSATDALEIYVDPSPGETSGSYSGSHEVDKYDEHTHLHNSGLAETGFSIGQADFSGGLSSLDTLVGYIDEVAIFDYVLAEAELNQLIASGPASF